MNSLNHYNLVHKFIPMPQAMEKSGCKGSSCKIIGKTGENSGMAADESQSKNEVIDEARNKGRKVHIASWIDLFHLNNSELEPRYQNYKQRQGRTPRWHCKRWFWFACSVHWTRIISITDDSRKWILFQDYQDAQDKQQTQYPQTPMS